MAEQTFRDKYYAALETQISHLKTINELTEKIDLLQMECDSKGQQLEELHKRFGIQLPAIPPPIVESESPVKAEQTIKCDKCTNYIDDELKADPYFTGVYHCQDCRKPKPYESPQKSSSPKLNSPPKAYSSPIYDSASTKSFDSPVSVFDNPLVSPKRSLEKPIEKEMVDTSLPIQVTDTPARIQLSNPAPSRNETISQYELCTQCGTLYTEGSWCPKGTRMCKKCFRAQTGNKGVLNRTCNQCKSPTTSKWYSDRQNIGAHICKSCYSKRRVIEKQKSKCNHCKTDKSIRWYLDSFDITKRLCLACFETRKKPKISQTM
ncbi:hypothetical protein HDV01_001278 [Terramyces sp. JEL0728]|nr:hypothetical protein HDV01_001278 [Terramyces sp. JEL0728]